MEQLTAFLTSNEGRMVCYGFIFVGIFDFLLAQILFGSKLKKLEQSMSSAAPHGEHQNIEKQVSGIKKAMNLVRFSGVFFITFAVFGLTR